MRILATDLATILAPWSRVSFGNACWDRSSDMREWCFYKFGPVACDYYAYIAGPELDAAITFEDDDLMITFKKESVWDRVRMKNCGPAFIFKHERDAVHFKLRWG